MLGAMVPCVWLPPDVSDMFSRWNLISPPSVRTLKTLLPLLDLPNPRFKDSRIMAMGLVYSFIFSSRYLS